VRLVYNLCEARGVLAEGRCSQTKKPELQNRKREARIKVRLSGTHLVLVLPYHGQVAVPYAILPSQLPHHPPPDGRRLAVLVLSRLPLVVAPGGVPVGHLDGVGPCNRLNSNTYFFASPKTKGVLGSGNTRRKGRGCDDDEGGGRRGFIEGQHWGLPFAARRLAPRAGEIDLWVKEMMTRTGSELGFQAKAVRPMGHKGARLATSGP
jgi:hypothetical protein